MKNLTATVITLTLVALLLGACVPCGGAGVAGRIARPCRRRNRVRTCRRVADLH